MIRTSRWNPRGKSDDPRLDSLACGAVDSLNVEQMNGTCAIMTFRDHNTNEDCRVRIYVNKRGKLVIKAEVER